MKGGEVRVGLGTGAARVQERFFLAGCPGLLAVPSRGKTLRGQ
jgi:hypothetical protein